MMKNTQSSIARGAFSCSSYAFNSEAHNPKISTFTLRDTGGGWTVEMSFAQVSVDVAMLQEHGKESVDAFSRTEYRDYVVEYVKDNFHLEVDGENTLLEKGGIMLGGRSDFIWVQRKRVRQYLTICRGCVVC